ncbi:MAG: hypothetical protein L6R28_24880 [Planctomycetes bacterium]|nr:hypothetical protein [Planctomycetota bacterium]
MPDATNQTGSAPEVSEQAWPLQRWQEALLLLVLSVAPYLPSFISAYGPLGLDDTLYWQHNPAIRDGAPSGLVEIWHSSYLSDYAPVAQATVWFDVAVAGSEPWRMARAQQMLWFALGVLGVWAFLRRATGRPGVSLSIAALFAVHPVCAQSVLWLAQRKNLVALAFVWWSCERYAAAREPNAPKEGALRYAAALALGALALLSKPHAVALPAILFAYEATLGRGALKTRALRWAPFAGLAAAFVAGSLLFLREDLERSFLGGSRAAAIVSDGPLVWRYLANTFWPSHLSFYYQVPELPAASGAGLAAWAGLVVLIAGSIFASRARALTAFGWLAAAAGLAPAINLLPQLAPMTDHYLQWALPGLLLLAAANITRPRAAWALAMAACVAFFAVTFTRAHTYRSKRTLFEAAVAAEPASALNRAQLVYALREAEDPTIGAQALAALEAPDADRLLAQDRALMIREAAVFLHDHGDAAGAQALLDRESAKLPQEGLPWDRLTRAEVALRTGNPDGAAQLIEPAVAPLAQAWTGLRKTCREGPRLPDAFPPVTSLQLEGNDPFARQWAGKLALRELSLLARARLDMDENEGAWDVAAVLVNLAPTFTPGRMLLAEACERLGMPEKAAALRASVANAKPEE